jgi:WD40 repeat protein
MTTLKRFFVISCVLFFAVSLTAQNIDLVDKAKDGFWRNGDGRTLTFGKEEGEPGSVMYKNDVVLEDGKTYGRVLYTHPQWKSLGRIEGRLANITVPEGRPRLVIAGGFIQNAQKSDGVRLAVVWIDPQQEKAARTQPLREELLARIKGRTPQEEASSRVLVALDIRYNGRIDRAELDISAYAGKTGDIYLTAEAGTSADSDWAVWTEARIESDPKAPVTPEPPAKAEPLKLLKSFGAHGARIYDAVFSPDGRFIATASAEQLAKIWRVPEGDEVATLSGHSAHVFAAAFSADSRLLATAGGDTTTRIWEVPGGGLKTRLAGHTREVLSAAFRRSGNQVATGSNDGTIRIWNTDDRSELNNFDFAGEAVNSLAFHPNNRWLAVAGTNGRVAILDVNTGSSVREFRGHTLAVYSIRFSQDGNRMVTGSRDGTVRVWNTSGGQFRQWDEGPGYAAAFDPSGRYIVVGHDGQGAIYNVETRERLMTLTHPGGALRGADWQPNGKLVVLAGENGQVRIWEVTID